MSKATIERLIRTVLDPKQWYPHPERELWSNPWLFPESLVAFIGSTMVPRKIRITVVTPAMLLLLSQAASYSSGDTEKDFIYATVLFGFMLKFIDFGLLVKDGEVYKVKDKSNSTNRARANEKSIWERFKNSVELWLFTARGIGWNWEVGGILHRESQSKRQASVYFLFRTFLRLIGSYIAFDFCKHAIGLFPYIQSTKRTPFFEQPWLDQVILTWLHQLVAFCVINLPYQVAAFIAVATGFQTSDEWPPLFGNLSDAHLVSRAWGRTWHQLLRRPLGMLTPYIQKLLRATSRSSKRTISLFCSFIMSGLAHWSGALNIPWAPNSYGMFFYFFMQAPVIRIEDYIVEWGQAKGIKENTLLKIIGYLWTFAWISFSMRYAAAYQYETGPLSHHELLEPSLIGWVISEATI